MVRELVGIQYLYLDTPIIVKPDPLTLSISIWAVCVSPGSGLLHVMDHDDHWREVKSIPEDEQILQSVYQRLQVINQQVKGGKAA